MKVFVTGGTGFVGRALLRALGDDGHEVRTLVRGASPLGSVDAIRGDLRDVGAFASALDGIDAVVHAAALLDPVDDEREADDVNRGATIALARAAADRGARAFVFVSSVAAVGIRSVGLVHAGTPCEPTTAYGRSKRAAEIALLAMTGPRIAVVRPPTVYGPGERRNFLALARAIDRGHFVVPGRGENRTSLCHVDDLARALVVAATREDARGIFHAAAEPVTLRDLSRALAVALGRRAPVRAPLAVMRVAARALELAARPLGLHPPLTPGRLRTLTSDFFLDTAPLEALGWRSTVPLAGGLSTAVDEWLSSGRLRPR